MGVAVVVLPCMGSLEPQAAVTLLGIGLACAGAAMLAKQKDRIREIEARRRTVYGRMRI